jgi:hypothetical protein
MITPETRIGALLEQYPGIEEELIRVAPAFAKLRNPVLRQTVAKVATLKQAARVGGISLGELMAHLEHITGEAGVGGEGAEREAEARPEWVREGRVAEDIDADAMLGHGVHPVGRVREACGFLGEGEILRLRSWFRPEPLLELMRRKGLAVYCEEEAPGRYVSYFGRRV